MMNPYIQYIFLNMNIMYEKAIGKKYGALFLYFFKQLPKYKMS